MNKVRRREGPVKFRDEKTVSGIGGRAVKLVNHLALALSDPPACTFSSRVVELDSKLARFASLLTRWNRGRNQKSRRRADLLVTPCATVCPRERCINGNYALVMQWNVAKRPRLRSSVNCISRFVAINAAFPCVGYDNIIKLLAWFGARFDRDGDCFCFRDLFWIA